MEQNTQNELKKMEAQFDTKLAANDLEVKKHEKLGMEKVRAVEEMLKQTEEDADKEILELKTKYEKILRSERESNVRLRGEGGIVKKKLQSVMIKETIPVFLINMGVSCAKLRSAQAKVRFFS